VSIVYHNQSASCEIELGEDWRVSLHENLLQSLAAWLTEPNIAIVYSGSARS
jgi:DNA polymerase-3 subunit alpha